MSNKEVRESAQVISGFSPYKADLYDGIDLDRLIVFTLWKLELANLPLYFDPVTVAAFKFFPQKFSMASFPEYPDTSRVDKAVRRLTDAKRKNWATGNVENGFYLTDLGREIAEEVEYSLSNPESRPKTIHTGRSRGRSSTDDMRDIRESDLFKQWKEVGKASPHEFFAFLKAAPYTPKALLVDRLKEINQSARDAKDAEATSFLIWIDESFGHLLSTL